MKIVIQSALFSEGGEYFLQQGPHACGRTKIREAINKASMEALKDFGIFFNDVTLTFFYNKAVKLTGTLSLFE